VRQLTTAGLGFEIRSKKSKKGKPNPRLRLKASFWKKQVGAFVKTIPKENMWGDGSATKTFIRRRNTSIRLCGPGLSHTEIP